MSSWFSSSVSISDQIQKATDESLPNGEQDLALNLEICDLIRSKTVPAKDAMRALKKRLLNKNPNVQIATLHLTDVCIKNGGIHFLVEIASREFMDSVVLLIKPGNSAVTTFNQDVQKLALECIQNWAHAFEGQLQLSYASQIYKQLKSEGYDFPASKQITSTFIDTSAPPEWIDSDTCMHSGTPFSFVNRKHHCRNCGGVFIQKHCNNYIPLPHFGINSPVRVCDNCNAKLKPGNSGSDTVFKMTAAPVAGHQAPAIDDDMDEDLRRALELSLAESGIQSSTSSRPSAKLEPSTAASNNDQDDDMDLKAAIAASLREMESANIATTQTSSESTIPVNQQSAAPSQPPPVQSWELTSNEVESINMYATLVDKMHSQPPGSILREKPLQELNDNISSLRPKLARTLAETVSRYDTLVDMNGKLSAALRLYDNMLEDRLSLAYGRQALSETSTGPSQPNYQQYQPYQPGVAFNNVSSYQANQPSAPTASTPIEYHTANTFAQPQASAIPGYPHTAIPPAFDTNYEYMPSAPPPPSNNYTVASGTAPNSGPIETRKTEPKDEPLLIEL
jgi:growth factor-regulated tyrosine kinase substrate